MRKVNLRLKIVTPAFIGAADNQKVSEFRLPSLKGLLRFWWRAHQDFPDEAKLYEAESQIFGDTTRKAKFSITLEKSLQGFVKSSLRQQAFNIDQAGIKYLFYPRYRMGRSPGRINCLEPGTSVDLQLRFFDEETVEKIVKEVITALWWLENFGGIGARSRRGAGSFQVTSIEGIKGIKGLPKFMCQEWKPQTQNLQKDIGSFLKEGIKSSYHPRTSQEIPCYTAFRNNINISNYRVLAGYRGWEEAVNAIGKKLSDFRKSDLINRSATFHNEAKALHTFTKSGNYKGPNRLTKTAFGLPITYHFRNIRNRFVVASGTEENRNRRASPLFIKIGCLPDRNQYYVVALSLWSKFLPDDEGVELEALKRNHKGKIQKLYQHTLAQPKNTAVNDFLNSL